MLCLEGVWGRRGWEAPAGQEGKERTTRAKAVDH